MKEALISISIWLIGLSILEITNNVNFINLTLLLSSCCILVTILEEIKKRDKK